MNILHHSETDSNDGKGIIDTDVESVLKSLGKDIETYRSLYNQRKGNDDEHTSQSYCMNGDEKEFNHRLKICDVCHGFGVIKSIYNHVIHESNCESCESEGIKWLNDKGLVVPLSHRCILKDSNNNEKLQKSK